MKPNLEISICRAAISLALRRPAPDVIPRSGARAKGVDCYVIQVGGAEAKWPFLVDSLDRKGLLGRWWNGNRFESECCIPYAYLAFDEVQITHYIGIYEFGFASPLSFLVQEVLRWPYLLIARDRIAQFFFNKQTLVRKDRIHVLRLIVEATLSERTFSCSSPRLMSLLYSNRWVFHPDKAQSLAYCSLLLDSLVASGDLTREQGAYRLAPKALATLAQFEEDERKHRDLIVQQRILKWLTAGLVLVGGAQVLLSWLRPQA